QQLYLSVDKENISLKKYFSSIEQNFKIGMIQDSVEFSIETEAIEIPTDKAVYIGLLITELIINSLKHAFENTSSKAIKIRASETDKKTIHIYYQDNGKGIEQGESPALVNLILKQLKASSSYNRTAGYNLYLKFQL